MLIALLLPLSFFTLALLYWAAHDPATIRMLADWHLDRSRRLQAWAKAQDARARAHAKALAKLAPPPSPPVEKPTPAPQSFNFFNRLFPSSKS